MKGWTVPLPEMFRITLASAFILCLNSVSLCAETFELKSGENVRGEVIYEGDIHYRVELEDGSQKVLFKSDLAQAEAGEQREEVETAKPTVVKEAVVPHAVQEEVRETAFSTAIIKYSSKGWIEGTETVYIDMTNHRIAAEKETISPLGGQMIKESERVVYDGKTVHAIDFEEKRIIKGVLEGEILSVAFGMMPSSQYVVGREEIAGKSCDVYKLQESEVCYWKGIRLKEEIKNPLGDRYNYTKEAVDIRLNVALPEDKFELPAGYRVVKAEEIMDEFEEKLKSFQ